jgi:transcriptional regulator with XRE-family HTH domain
MEGLGDRLRVRARELGWSDAEVARRVGVGQTRYANYVTDRHEPDLATLARICAVLRYSPSDLLAWPAALTEESARLSARIGTAVAALDDASLSVLATVADGLVAVAPARRVPRVGRTGKVVR